MTKPTTEQMREEFEAWAMTQGHSITLANGKMCFFAHHDDRAEHVWRAWQAAYLAGLRDGPERAANKVESTAVPKPFHATREARKARPSLNRVEIAAAIRALKDKP